MKKVIWCLVLPVSLLLLTANNLLQSVAAAEDIPSPPREFRAAWVATVANIDWPSRPGLSSEQQQQEALAILDQATTINLNAIILQVRPQADALYASELEPWSYYLTGQQGKPPDPYYDPLEFWVKEAHARGLELHCWFNPYRANHPAHKGELSEKSIVKAHPEMVKKLGTKGYYWMDPALKSVQDHSIAVVMDVVKRYDIDGVHFDDYFYPYWDYNDGKDFPDDDTWNAYKEAGGTLSRNDWRRANVNTFIQRLYYEIKATKPYVKFGISPFGIWRPGYPPGVTGFDQYDKLYADAKLWLNEGWVDYFTPQLYWPISRPNQSFPILLGWWASENLRKRHLWPGLSISGSRDEAGALETVNQIYVTRGIVPDSPGNVMFSMKGLMGKDNHLVSALLKGPYKNPALVPASTWLDAVPPEAPEVKVKTLASAIEASWSLRAPETPFLWILYTKEGENWNYKILPAVKKEIKIENPVKPITAVAVSAVDKAGNESKKTIVKVSE